MIFTRRYTISRNKQWKVVKTIYEIIQKEWDFECNLALEWNHLCNQIDALSINDHNKWGQVLSEYKKDHQKKSESE